MTRVLVTVINDLAYDRRMLRIIDAMLEMDLDITVFNVCKAPPLKREYENFTYIPLVTKAKKGPRFYTEVIYRLVREARLHSDFDLLYSVDYDTLVAGRFIRKNKWVYDAHELYHEVPELSDQRVKKWLWQKAALPAIQTADLCITVSTSLAEYYRKLSEKDFTVVANYPLLEDTTPTTHVDSNIILYQGAINAGREIDLLLQSMVELEEMKAIIVGEGDLYEEMRKLSGSLGLEHRVDWFGKVVPEELSSLTEQAFLGFNLLEASSLSYYYSLSNKFSDYFHAGVPSLSSHLPEYERLCEAYHVGRCIDNTVGDIVQNVRDLKTHPELYKNYYEGCLQARSVLNWQTEKNELQTKLKQIL